MFWQTGFFVELILIVLMLWVFIKANPMMNAGAASWIDIYSKDPVATISFLENTFKTKLVANKPSEVPGIDYKVIKADGQLWPFAGIMGLPEKDILPHAMIYLTVKDYADAHKKMMENGAKAIMTDKFAGGMKFGIYIIPGGVDIGIAEWTKHK